MKSFVDPNRERIYRRNFFFFLTDATLFMVALGIIGSTTVIPDFVRNLTDSEILIGFSGNIFTVGFALPQLFIAHYIVRHERKKWWFIGPNIPIRFVILIFAAITVWLGKNNLELILPVFFICYSIAALGDGLVGVPWADLSASSLNNRWRARMFGLSNVFTGLIMLLLAPVIGFILGGSGLAFPDNYALVFAVSGIIFAISTLPGLFFHELPGGKAIKKLPTFGELFSQLGNVLREDGSFRAFIVARIFDSLFMMAAPFYIGFATVQLGLSSDVAVPTLLAMQTIGSFLGALLYTWLGARDNLLVVRLWLAAAMLWPISALLAENFGAYPLYFGFLISGMVMSNIMFAYLNWLVEYATPEQRPIYVGLSNTVVALVSLITPIIGGSIAQYLGYRSLFFVALLMISMALFVSLRFLHDKKEGLSI